MAGPLFEALKSLSTAHHRARTAFDRVKAGDEHALDDLADELESINVALCDAFDGYTKGFDAVPICSQRGCHAVVSAPPTGNTDESEQYCPEHRRSR